MDAYDVFKKISFGAKITRQHNPKKVPLKCGVIKEEPFNEPTENKSIKPLKGEENDSITLLATLKNEPKEKKRKELHPEAEELKEKKLKQEEVNHYRNLNRISVVGKHVPEPAKAFEDYAVDELIKQNLRKSGYSEPTPVQKQAVPIMLNERNILACAPTGSGKTAAFLVPIIQHLKGPKKKGFRALILCPTRELAKQTQVECTRLSEGKNLRIHYINKIKNALTQYGPNSPQKFDILITTPNRLCFLLQQDPPGISLSSIEWVVIDEADKLFESGHRSFRDQLDQILLSCSNSNKKIAMFSATYTPVVAKWCVRNMKGLIRLTVGHRNAATDSVDQELLFVGNEQGKLLAFRDIVRNGLQPPVLIFVQSKDRAQQLFNELVYDGINVDAIHSDRTQLQRDNTVRSFREGKIWVLICTELMARGIDFVGVNLVINYDFPPSAISYVHRVGRAGRAGKRGKAITFFTIEDTVNLRSIAHLLKESGCEVPEYMLTLKKRPRKEKKKLERSAPERDDIDTRPKYEKMKIKRRIQGKKQKEENGLEKKKKSVSKKDKIKNAMMEKKDKVKNMRKKLNKK